MKNKIKSVSEVFNFFKKLDTYKNNKIFIYTDKSNALDAAKICDQRIHQISKIDGKLFAIKPNIRVKSFPFTGGIRDFQDTISNIDDAIIEMIKANGGIIIGSTNMDEAAFGGDTSSSYYGRCINPINEDFTVGGSSGGSAAAISSGLVDYSLGTDTMGSIRIPASYCGIVGFKPSQFIFNNKNLKLLSHTYDTIGFMSNNTNYIKNLYELYGKDHKNFKDYIKTNKNIKCLIPKEIFEDKLNEDVLTGFKYIISELKKYKIDIEIKNLKYWKPDIHRKYLLKIVENEGALNLKTLLENERSNISKNLRNSLIYGKNIEPLTLNNIKKELKELKNKVNAFFESYDLIIMPTTPQRAFEIKTDVPKNQANFTSLANICDLPSISLPYYYKGKLPYSLQLLAPNMNDHFLLRISSYFEEILQ